MQKRTVIAWWLALVLAIPALGQKSRLIRGPYLQAATSHSIVVRWRTDVTARSRVSAGYTPGAWIHTVSSNEYVTEHEVRLTGLQPGTRYYYSIGGLQDTLQGGDTLYFTTLPQPGVSGHYRIGVFGDCGYLSVRQSNVRDQFLHYLGDQDLNAWILLGDNAYNDGNDAEYQAKFFNVYKGRLLQRYPVYPAPGNHDYHDADFTSSYAQNTHQTAYYQNFTLPVAGEAGGIASGNEAFYSFDIGNAHFLSLDSYGMEDGRYFMYDSAGPQLQWVKRDLAANRNKGWVIAYWHHPPYSMGTHNSDTDDNMRAIREQFIRHLENLGVDLVLCGHSHVYERSRLMRGHYGLEATFNPKLHDLSSSSGSHTGDRPAPPYIKNDTTTPGTVYVVTGSASYVGKPETSFPHDALPYCNATVTGAAILEVQENRLDFKWICEDGLIRDHFTMMKNVNRTTTLRVKKGQTITLTASYIGDYEWNNGARTRSISIQPRRSGDIYRVHDAARILQDEFEVILVP